MRGASLRVDELLDALTPEHFADHRVPAKSTVSDWLAGRTPRWDFVEAVADICSHDSQAAARLTEQARPLWDKLRSTPTPVSTAFPPAGDKGALVLAQQQTIDVQNQLIHAQQALASSRQAEANAGHLVILLLQMIGRLNLRIGELARQADRLHTHPTAPQRQEQDVRRRLAQAEEHRQRAVREKDRAEAKQREALDLVDQASREIDRLRAEVHHLKSTAGADEPEPGQLSALVTPDNDIAFLDDIAQSLDKAAHVNDTGDQLTQDARGALGEPAFTSWDVMHAPAVVEAVSDNPNNPATSDAEPDNTAVQASRFGAWLAQRATRTAPPAPSAAAYVRRIQSLDPPLGPNDFTELLDQAALQLPLSQLLELATDQTVIKLGNPYDHLLLSTAARPPKEVATLIAHLSEHGAGASNRMLLLLRHMRLDQAEQIATQLRESGHDDEARDLLRRAASDWPTAETVQLTERIKAEGYSSEARILLTHVGMKRPFHEVTDAVNEALAAGHNDVARALLNGATAGAKPWDLVELITHLRETGHLDHGAFVLGYAARDLHVKATAEIISALQARDYPTASEDATTHLPAPRARLINTALEKLRP
ncbi:hypothetical protein P3T36_007674 [Kitasatospora sp. MAP12-15]|uniref:hypothetical protein n=1 Tax=unclassified Kitasatospora TaxID=2633591 RepID=UPI0024762002|nr:hypothetical protein [Kitasatospora sp. MAP12-44]MDH6108006.1 hypothetical protein [Kitasatospora sp. MAP12-44]MDH6115698.1 hypothetical protein [Kitasatospora sp. MAP12-44]